LLKFAFEQAQQSAEHHDTLLWEATYIVWGSTTLLLGFVLEAAKLEPFLWLPKLFFRDFLPSGYAQNSACSSLSCGVFQCQPLYLSNDLWMQYRSAIWREALAALCR